jgi:hypothetical protein
LQDVFKKHLHLEIEWELKDLQRMSAILDSAAIFNNEELQQVNFDCILFNLSKMGSSVKMGRKSQRIERSVKNISLAICNISTILKYFSTTFCQKVRPKYEPQFDASIFRMFLFAVDFMQI